MLHACYTYIDSLPSVLQKADPDLPPLASHGLHRLSDLMNLVIYVTQQEINKIMQMLT